jgi:hypothetical protein
MRSDSGSESLDLIGVRLSGTDGGDAGPRSACQEATGGAACVSEEDRADREGALTLGDQIKSDHGSIGRLPRFVSFTQKDISVPDLIWNAV